MKRLKPILADASYGMRILPQAGLRQLAIDEGVIEPEEKKQGVRPRPLTYSPEKETRGQTPPIDI